MKSVSPVIAEPVPAGHLEKDEVETCDVSEENVPAGAEMHEV